MYSLKNKNPKLKNNNFTFEGFKKKKMCTRARVELIPSVFDGPCSLTANPSKNIFYRPGEKTKSFSAIMSFIRLPFVHFVYFYRGTLTQAHDMQYTL